VLIQLVEQSRTVETTMAALQDDSNSSLPPLMNPTMLEASEDLTNLSHLNEPAGISTLEPIILTQLIK
jgi:myosin V